MFKSRGFLIGIAVALAALAVVLAGVWLDWGWVVTLLVLAVVLLFGAVLALFHSRATSAARGIEQQILVQAQQQRLSARPDQQGEIEQLQEHLERAIETLKQSKLGRKGWWPGGGSAALYALPWYLFIGPPGAGKTTAIANSGLRFPVGADRVRGVGGTRNCDWFFTDQAILLDTAGRYVTEAEDAEEWFAFLEILKKHRRERPINGVLVAVPLDELAGAGPAGVEELADTLRRRIDELVERLGLRFPVYLLFTKVDLLQGFVEFFGELSRREREALWGATLVPQEEHDPRAVFEREFELLEEALLNHRSARLRRSMKREERSAVYHFPLQLASLRENLGRFIERLFQPNPYQETPLLRGFYFTSGTQEGAPLDRVIQAIAAEFDLPPELTGGFQPEVEAKSYFIKDLFTEVVVPDEHLARRTSRAATQQRLAKAGVTVAALVGLALFVVAISQASVRSRMDLERTRSVAALAAEVDWRRARPGLPELSRLDSLRQEVRRLEGGPPLLQLGLSRRGSVLGPARQLYLGQVRDLVEAYPLTVLRRRLALAADSSRRGVYDDLKAYLLLTSERERLGGRGGEANANFLAQHLALAAREALHGADSAALAPPLRERIEAQMAAFAEGLRRGRAAPFAPEPALVARVRAQVYEQPSVRGVYERLKSEGAAQLPPFRLAEAVGRHGWLFEEGDEVAGLFTKRGWEEFARGAFEEAAEDPGRDDWVAGRAAGELPPEMQDSAQMLAGLHAHYFAEYAQAWEQFMRGVRYRPFGDARHAAEALELLGSPTDSPLLHLLAQVTEQTSFEGVPGAAEGVLDAAGRRVSEAARRITGGSAEAGAGLHPLSQRFAGLHALKAGEAVSGGAAPELYAVLEALGQVGGALGGAVADPGQAAEFAAGVLQQGGGELDRTLAAVRRGLRIDTPVRQTLFEQPVRVAWGAILAMAQRHLNERWRAEVHAPFQATLAGHYPLEAGAGQDAPLAEFERFFRPRDGVVAAFEAEALGPFLTRDGSPRSWEGRAIALSPSARNALARAREIGEGLFAGGSLRLEFELQPDVPEREGGAPPPQQVYASFHGTDDVYRMGSYRPWTSFAWPGRPGALLAVTTQQGELPPRQFSGDWAWFRLLQGATVRRASSTEYEVRWPFRQQADAWSLTVRYALRPRSSAAPFSDPRAFFAFAPPASLD